MSKLPLQETPRSRRKSNVPRVGRYGDSDTFKDVLLVVRHDLNEAAKEHLAEVDAFLQWAQPETLRRDNIEKKIRQYPAALQRTIRLYVAFVLRFRVTLELHEGKDTVSFGTQIEEISGPQLRARIEHGKLQPAVRISSGLALAAKGKRISHGDVVSVKTLIKRGKSPLVAQATVAQLRDSLRRRGIPAGHARIRIVELSEDVGRAGGARATLATQILDAFYDPVDITFVVFRSRNQPYLLSLIGELVDAKDWEGYGAILAALHKQLYGVSPAGRRLNREKRSKNLSALGRNEIVTKSLVIEHAIGSTERDLSTQDKSFRRSRHWAEQIRKSLLRE